MIKHEQSVDQSTDEVSGIISSFTLGAIGLGIAGQTISELSGNSDFGISPVIKFTFGAIVAAVGVIRLHTLCENINNAPTV